MLQRWLSSISKHFKLNADKNYNEAKDRLRILVGSQSLWYYLGLRSPQIK